MLLAHERAHARNSHYLFTSAARLAAAANPLLRPVTAEIGYAIERWADERAAAETGDRALAARAVARAALAAAACPPDRDAAVTALGLITQEGERRGNGEPARRKRASAARPVPARYRAASPPCSPRPRGWHPGRPRCCSPRPCCSWSSPAPRPWTRPATCTSSSSSPSHRPARSSA